MKCLTILGVVKEWTKLVTLYFHVRCLKIQTNEIEDLYCLCPGLLSGHSPKFVKGFLECRGLGRKSGFWEVTKRRKTSLGTVDFEVKPAVKLISMGQWSVSIWCRPSAVVILFPTSGSTFFRP